MTNKLIKQTRASFKEARRSSDKNELKYAKLNLNLAKDASNLYQILIKYKGFFDKYVRRTNPKYRARADDETNVVLGRLNPDLHLTKGSEAHKHRELNTYHTAIVKFLQHTRMMKSKWDTEQHMSAKIGKDTREEHLEMTNPCQAKILKDAKKVIKTCKSTLYEKKNIKYLFNAVKLNEHYNEYGDFKHPDSKYNKQFEPISVKNKAVNNMYWLAYDWLNLFLNTKDVERGRSDDFTSISGFTSLTRMHFDAIKTHKYIPTPITPETDPSIYQNNKD